MSMAQLAQALGGAQDLGQVVLGVGVGGGEPQQLGVAGDDEQAVLEVVDDGAGHLAHGGQHLVAQVRFGQPGALDGDGAQGDDGLEGGPVHRPGTGPAAVQVEHADALALDPHGQAEDGLEVQVGHRRPGLAGPCAATLWIHTGLALLEHLPHAGHGQLDVLGQVAGAQVALDLDHQFALLGQHDEAALGAGEGQQAVEGLLQEVVQLHLPGEQGGGLEDGLQVHLRGGGGSPAQGEEIGPVRQLEGAARFPAHALTRPRGPVGGA